MIASRCLVLLVCLLLAGGASAQGPVAGASPVTAALPTDERAARVAERYKAMLLANPAEGLALDRLWKFYDERGSSGALIEEFRGLANAPGAGVPPALIYGDLLKRAGRLDEAEANYERAEKLDPASPPPQMALAELALMRAQPEEAARRFAAALEKMPAVDRRQLEILFKLGAAWMSAGQPLNAVESWEKTIAHDPANIGLRRQIAASYEKNGLSERALSHYEYIEAHAAPPERAAALRDLARLHETRGEFDAARDALELGLALTARDNWLHGELETRLIRLYQRAGRVPELEARWRAAVEVAPRDLGGYLRLEALAEAQGDLAGERGWLEKIVALAPRERDYTLKLARRLADDGDRTRAAGLYDELLKTQPDSVDLILARADLDLQLGQPAAAVDRVETRLARNPADESVATPALAFFLEHHLNAAAEKCLRAEVARHPAADEPALALAKFLFAQRKGAEAHAALDALTGQPADDAARGARWARAAEVYREQNLPVEALHGWQEAAKLQPRSPAPLLAAGDYLLARGDKTAASEQFERASSLVSGQEQAEVERKLFGVLQSMDEPGEGRGEPPVTIPHVLNGSSTIRADQPLGRYLSKLEKMASDVPSGDNFLRLARWQSWAHLAEPALASAAKAVAVDPANVDARQLIVSVAADLHRPVAAEAQLQDLAARDPTHKNGYLRQLANLKMDDGDRDAGVAIFAQVQQDAPGSREALTDLALAQQRADRWYDALATWERAYALPVATPAKREEIRRPLLAVYERLGQFPRAAELLRGSVDEQTDLTAKNDLFHQLAAFCHRHDLGPGLREEYEKRLAARPEDYFLLTALAELRREDGQERAAYALAQQAYYSSPDPARTLRELADQAEQLGEDAEAVAHQRRLVALPNQATAENLEKLATLEDADLEESAAVRTWDNLVAKFPRDTAVLGRAAEFFQQAAQIDRARALLRQLIAVDGTDTRRLLLLANLDAQASDGPGARMHYEQLLAQTTPEPPDEALLVPPELEPAGEPSFGFGSGRLGAILHASRAGRTVIPVATGNEERRWRLQAIESMSRLLFPKGTAPDPTLAEAQTAWLQRWQAAAAAGAKSEPLAAFYFSARQDPTMTLLARWMERDDSTGETALNAFLTAGLRLGGYRRLAEWTWRGNDGAVASARGQKLLGALRNYLSAGGKPGPGMVEELFPADIRVQELLWTAAQNGFAASRWYVQAAELGERVLASASSGRAGYGVQVAEWELYAGNPERAREALRLSLDDVSGDSLETGNPAFVALRSYYLMLPETERPAFVQNYLRHQHPRIGLAHALLTAVLLHGLSGDEAAARRDLDQLLAMRMLSTEPAVLSPDVRRWAYLLANGEQLQAWNLDSLAIYLWRHALQEAGAFDRQISDADNSVTEIRHRLLNAELATSSDPQQAREYIQEFLNEQSEPAVISSVAGQLWTDGQRGAAARLYEILCQTDPANTEYWPNLYTYYDSTGNQDAAERLLDFMLDGPRSLPAGVNRADLTCNLAALREKRGDIAGACRLLERARLSAAGTLPVLFQLAQTYERAGRWDDAAKVWRESLPLDPSHTARLGLAAAEDHRGQRSAAIEVLRGGLKDGPDPGRVELAVRLTQFLLVEHRAEEAHQFASDLIKQGQFEALSAIASAFTTNGQRAVARDILSTAVLHSRDPVVRFNLQMALAEQSAVPGEDAAGFVRQMRRLARLARATDGLHNEYESVLYPLAHQQGADAWLEGELQREWKQGQGDPAAGAQLAGLYLQNHREDALREVVRTIDHRPDLPEEILYTLATSLVETDHAPLALALCERLANRFPQKQEYQLERALALWKSDRQPEANQLLTSLSALSVFGDDVLPPIAAFYLQHGDKNHAAEYLERIVESDPEAAYAPQAWLQLAQIALDENRVAEAGRLLRVAYARPACDDLGPLVRYLAASGRLEGEAAREMPASEFPLTFTRRARLLAAVRDELVRNGRAEDGERLTENHAEYLAAIPAVAAELRQAATPANIGTVADCLERAVSQRALVPPRIGHELAALYTQWAAWDVNDPTAQNAALAHLSRAHELEPDDFPLACQLARQCFQRKQPERAGEVLAAFLTAEALPLEREQARQILLNQ